jgi:putative ABC transport system ATP-binding protein
MTTLSCRNLTHTYGKAGALETALDDVSVEFSAGEICLLMGPSGSGKTTLLSICGCLLQPSGGEMFVEGEPIHDAPLSRLTAIRRKTIGFVFQHSQLLPFLSLEENLRIVGRNAGIRATALAERIDSLLDRLEIRPWRRRYPHEVSGGQRQRFAIARALVHRPRIVLADEPTAALDWRHGESAMRLLIDEARASGSLLITVSHDSRLLPLFERVLNLENGRIVTDSASEVVCA